MQINQLVTYNFKTILFVYNKWFATCFNLYILRLKVGTQIIISWLVNSKTVIEKISYRYILKN